MAKKRVPKKYIRTEADKKAVSEGCWWDEAAGLHCIEFIETFCVYSKGDAELIGQPVQLLEWQKDFLMRLFSWKKKNGRRRFRSASVWIPKKNGDFPPSQS